MTHEYKAGPPPANRLVDLRTRSRLTQKEVGKLIGKDDALVCSHENLSRRMTPKDVKAYAKVFKVETYELFVNPDHALEE